MSLLKQMIASGMLDGSPITGQAKEEVDKLLDYTPSGDWRGQGKDLTFVMVRGTTYVYDFDGYLCRTQSIEGIMMLLLLTDSQAGARAALFPEKAAVPEPRSKLDAHFADLAALKERARTMRAEMQDKRGLGPAGSSDFDAGDGTGFRAQEGQVVRQVGLGDGPPEFR